MSNTTVRAWLTVAHGGGRWTLAEIAQELPRDNYSTLSSATEAMACTGCLEVYEPDEKNRYQRYGVTSACRVPRGVTAWEVVEAMGMRLRPEVDDGELVKGMTVAEVLRKMAVQKAAA